MLFDPPPVSQCSKTFFSHSEEDTSEGAGIILHRQRKVQDSWKSTLDSAIKIFLSQLSSFNITTQVLGILSCHSGNSSSWPLKL